MASSLPTQAFDGQIFIDAHRVKWEFDGSIKCWKKIGTVPDVPMASEFQPGLLSARLKGLLDSIPTNGGHFGIIAKPLLSLVPQNPKPLYEGQVRRAIKVAAGTQLFPLLDRQLSPDQFLGKVLIFKSGLLVKRAFLIFSNDSESFYLEGDVTEVQKGDVFVVADLSELNPSGILLGDIMLVSDSIDISCVDSDGVPIKQDCSVIPADTGKNPPGLNFQLSQTFLENFCVTLPGCKGPKGDRGDKGPPGLDGTGDGPKGETGDPGEDAPAVAHSFTGIKIIDVDDIYDTAVVAMELDAPNGRLNVIRAKVRTPDDNTAATQVVSTPIDRSIHFPNDKTFDYQIMMPPNGDPIGTADVDLLKYPRKFNPNRAGEETNVYRLKLSGLIDKVVEVLEAKLSDINDQYNRQLKEYIEGKDEAARQILANLAHQLSECEWELPIEFCLGISPSDCHPDKGDAPETREFDFPLGGVLFGTSGVNQTATDLGTYTVNPSAEDSLDDLAVHVMYPYVGHPAASTSLPPGGYIVQYVTGAIKSSDTDWVVGSEDEYTGLKVFARDGGAPETTHSMPIPSATFNPKEFESVQMAYTQGQLSEKTVSVEITDPTGGSIYMRAPLPGLKAIGDIKVKVLKVDLA